MFKQYQRRFVALIMAMLTVVMAAVVVSIGVYMHKVYYSELENTMSQVIEPFNSIKNLDKFAAEFKGDASGQPDRENQPPEMKGDRKPPDSGDPERDKLPLKYQNTADASATENYKSIVTVFYHYDTGDIDIISQSSEYDEQRIKNAVTAALEQQNAFGTLDGYEMIYYKRADQEVCKFALTDKSYITSQMVSLILILSVLFVLSLAVFFVISYYFSRVAVKPLKKAHEMERQFITDISHDLKTPLTVILANNKIIKDNPEEKVSDQTQWLDSTEDAAKNMLSMINEMLTLSSLENTEPGKQEPTTEEINLSSYVTRACLQMESVAFEREITLDSNIEDDITVSINPDFIKRICSGLIDNALKYEPAGGRIDVSLISKKKKAVLSVSNQNSFIPAGDLPRIFERFYRSDKARTDQKGHGLGLSIIKEMVEQSGGTITADSSEQQGTVFTVTLNQI